MREVTITAERYEQLLNCETRVEVAISLLANDKYMSVENILRILGAVKTADSLKATESENAKEHLFSEMLEE